jgi:hypothetical protein
MRRSNFLCLLAVPAQRRHTAAVSMLMPATTIGNTAGITHNFPGRVPAVLSLYSKPPPLAQAQVQYRCSLAGGGTTTLARGCVVVAAGASPAASPQVQGFMGAAPRASAT